MNRITLTDQFYVCLPQGWMYSFAVVTELYSLAYNLTQFLAPK